MAEARRIGAPPPDRGVCLSMHQPWASLLVYGIKRIEGRGWSSDHRGRLWIAATAKQPTEEEVEEMESFYRSVHAPTLPEFPPAYPTGVLLGCVEVVDVVAAEQVESWEGLPPGLQAEVGSPHCFLCQQAQRLVVPQQMRGWPKLFDLEKKLHKIAQLGLKPAPNSQDFRWTDFGSPPPLPGLAPSQNKHKYQELQRKMDAAQAGSEGCNAEEGGVAGSGGKAAKGSSCQSPRAAAAAAAKAGLPRAVALQQQHQQVQVQAQQAVQEPQQAQQQDPQKRLRAVQKKLRQIAALEEKLASGQVVLSPEESEKVGQRQQLEAEAAVLAAAI